MGDVILKKIIALITVILLTLSFASCGRKMEETIKDIESDTTSSKENTVTENVENDDDNTEKTEKPVISDSANKKEPVIALPCPNFIGMKITDIKSNPDYTENFEFVDIWEENNDVGYGYVFGQSERANAPLGKGTKITLKVSMGKSMVKIPNVVGLTESQAVAQLESLGLKVKVVKEYSASCEEGSVINTEPQETTLVQSGSTITVIVSKGKDPDKETMEGFLPWR